MTTDDPGAAYLDDPTPLTVGTSATTPQGVSPVRHALAQIAADRILDDERPEAFRPTPHPLDVVRAVPLRMAEAQARARALNLPQPWPDTPDALDAATERHIATPAPAPAGMPVRILGRPYRANPHPDGRPGYTLTPDRAQRLRDRITP